MESNLSFFSLPFIDNADVDFTLPSHGSLLGADDVLAQFLSGDELLEEPDLNGPTILHCEICRKQFDNAKKYYGHLRVHSKGNLWICDKCPNEKFSSKQHLMKHSLTHKPLERVWRCSQCDMSFEALWRLQQHLFAKHTDYRPHKCDRCEMSFYKLSDMKKHKDIHNNEKRHKCNVCARGFNDVSNLNRHKLSHGNEKPYSCPGCGNRFKQLASMKRHSGNCTLVVKQEAGNKIRQNHCRVCSMTFQYKSALLEHCVRQHSNNPPTPNEASNENTSNGINTDNNRAINNNTSNSIDNSTHIDNTGPRNIDTTHANSTNLVNLNTNQLHQINIDTNQIGNVDTNNQMNLNILTNAVNLNMNSVNMNTNLVNINTNSINIERNQTVDNIVDDILSAEDDYLIRDPMSNQVLNFNPEPENHENLINQIELLKEMNQMHILDDELLYNDIDFDSFQTMCNTNDMDYTDRNELLFDIPDGRSMDQDIMNELYQVRGDITDLMNEPEVLNMNTTEKVNDFLINPAVSVNECATIFESDVDLEASTNLAANLNQLIGENNVQYISTEHDDTFIISLNSEIDAEQLTDMLNIGVQPVEESNNNIQEIKETKEHIESVFQPVVVKIENLPENNIPNYSNQFIPQPISLKIKSIIDKNKASDERVDTPKIVKTVKRVYYVCRKCNKIFNRKDNYKSHRATHEPSLRRHACGVCGQRFSYRSTLCRHVRARHTPLAARAHACTRAACGRTYQAAWMLKRHVARDHDLILPFKCEEKDCGKSFYMQADLDVHTRFHKDERPYTCATCQRSFHLVSHLKRHIQKHTRENGSATAEKSSSKNNEVLVENKSN